MKETPAASPPRARWLHAVAGRATQSLGARIVTVSLALLLLVQVASFTAISASLSAHARKQLPEKLAVGERVLQTLLDQRSQKLAEGGRLLAADYGFREAVLSNDAETIASVLSNHGARIGATETALLGTNFALQASSGGDRHELAPLGARLAAQAATAGTATDIALLGGLPHQVVLVPMKAPVLVGWVLMGFPLDARLPEEMRALSALHVTLLTRPDPAQSWTAALTSLPAPAAGTIARQVWPQDAERTGLRALQVEGEEFGTRATWLAAPTAQRGSTAAGPAVVAVLSLSVDEAARTPRDLQLALLAITVIAFGVFVVGSLFTARRVTTPLRELGAAAERLGAGDYDTPMRGQRRHDEIGQLAQAFEHMRVSVGEKQAQILKLAYWDPLTGLPNRAQFRDAVRDAIAEAGTARDGTGSVAVVMLDLDRFKHVNDVLGYRFGDLVLNRIAERLTQQVLRGGDLVARLGGDEFAVLLRRADEALAQQVAQRIHAAFDVPLQLEEHTVDMGAGIGIACWPDHAHEVDMLLSRAEVAMYAGKRRQQGPLTYSPGIDAASAQTLSLLSELRHAVDRHELCLYLQPKLSLGTGRIGGAEALVRWNHPRRGLVPPMEFIPFAEQTGFIRTLTLWVFEQAARQWHQLQSDGLPLVISVNLSTRDLLDQELPQKFDRLLVKHRVPAEAFCLEITESAIMDDPQRALGTLNRLSGLGFKLSIDDFGTGYSSLAYLKRLPVDELKIDKSFVMTMEKDLDDAKIVRSTIDLAHNLGLTVVAEGVENAKVWELLRELECDEAQGYHMSKPLPAADFHAWAAAWAARHQPRLGAASAFMLH